MRERYIITVTDYRGARHYTLTQLMRRMIAGVAGLLAVVFLGGTLIIYGLSHRVSSLNSEVGSLRQHQSEIRRKNQALISEQGELQQAVQQKAEALAQLSDNLDQIEMLIGLKPEPEQNLLQRLDTASLTAHEKRLMLESIPSGMPLQDTRLTSKYGMRMHPVLNRKAMHGGLDMSAAIGTPIFATASGVVEWAAPHKSSGLGNMIKLNHNYGFSSTYGHLSKILVKTGDYVQRGDLIGHTGNTGMSSAPHLHYEVRYLHRRLDPKPFTEWSFENYDVIFERAEHIKWESLAESVRKAVISPERLLLQAEPRLSVISN